MFCTYSHPLLSPTQIQTHTLTSSPLPSLQTLMLDTNIHPHAPPLSHSHALALSHLHLNKKLTKKDNYKILTCVCRRPSAIGLKRLPIGVTRVDSSHIKQVQTDASVDDIRMVEECEEADLRRLEGILIRELHQQMKDDTFVPLSHHLLFSLALLSANVILFFFFFFFFFIFFFLI